MCLATDGLQLIATRGNQKFFQLALRVTTLRNPEPSVTTEDLPAARNQATAATFVLELNQARGTERPQTGLQIRQRLLGEQTVTVGGKQ